MNYMNMTSGETYLYPVHSWISESLATWILIWVAHWFKWGGNPLWSVCTFPWSRAHKLSPWSLWHECRYPSGSLSEVMIWCFSRYSNKFLMAKIYILAPSRPLSAWPFFRWQTIQSADVFATNSSSCRVASAIFARPSKALLLQRHVQVYYYYEIHRTLTILQPMMMIVTCCLVCLEWMT